MEFEEAQENCATKFPGGRLFEPHTKSIHDKVVKAEKDVTRRRHYFYIGITDKTTEGIWRYESSGNKVSDSMTLPWISGSGNRGTSRNCVETYSNPSHSNFH